MQSRAERIEYSQLGSSSIIRFQSTDSTVSDFVRTLLSLSDSFLIGFSMGLICLTQSSFSFPILSSSRMSEATKSSELPPLTFLCLNSPKLNPSTPPRTLVGNEEQTSSGTFTLPPVPEYFIVSSSKPKPLPLHTIPFWIGDLVSRCGSTEFATGSRSFFFRLCLRFLRSGSDLERWRRDSCSSMEGVRRRTSKESFVLPVLNAMGNGNGNWESEEKGFCYMWMKNSIIIIIGWLLRLTIVWREREGFQLSFALSHPTVCFFPRHQLSLPLLFMHVLFSFFHRETISHFITIIILFFSII